MLIHCNSIAAHLRAHSVTGATNSDLLNGSTSFFRRFYQFFSRFLPRADSGNVIASYTKPGDEARNMAFLNIVSMGGNSKLAVQNKHCCGDGPSLLLLSFEWARRGAAIEDTMYWHLSTVISDHNEDKCNFPCLTL